MPNAHDSVNGVPDDPHELPTAAETVFLVASSKEGDRASVNELFRRYQPRLRRVVRIKMGSFLLQHVDPDDIVQETCIIAMDKLSGFEVKTTASTMQWLTKISEFVIKNKLERVQAQKRDPRRERQLRTSESSTDSISGVYPPADEPTPSQIVSRQELEEQIDLCVAKLEPEDFRQIILFKDYFGMSWEDIRVKLDRPSVDAVRELHRRACAKLKDRLRVFR